MALFNSKVLYKFFAVSKFPICLKDDFKINCKKKKVEMVGELRSLVRGYVNETNEMFISKEFKKIEKNQMKKYDEFTCWGVSSFPVKLLADFKSSCAVRGDKMGDALIHLIKNYNEIC